jgi:acetyl esterase/lipase
MLSLSSFLNSGVFAQEVPFGLSLDTSKLFVAGASAGGYLAFQYALHATPKPRGVISLYGMIDLMNEHYLHPRSDGIPFPGGKVLRQSIEPFIGSKSSPSPCSASPFLPPKWHCPDGRHFLVYHMRQEGNRLDYITGERGLSELLRTIPSREARIQKLDERHHILLPLFRVKDFPPTVFIHGDEDSEVPLDDSRITAGLLQEASIMNKLLVVVGAEHGLVSKENRKEAEGSRAAYDEAMRFLDNLLGL